jgi:dipeptidyl aminopeptidase/acylaminoacyl peptidase
MKVRARRKNFLIWITAILGGAVVLAAIIYLAFGVVFYLRLADVKGSCEPHSVNRPDRIVFTDNWPPIDLARYAMPNYETIRFPSRQPGINLAGWWVEGKPGAPAVILVHGLGGCKNAIDVLVPAGMLWRNGFSVLMIDLRNIGESDFVDGRSTAGNVEYQDVLGAWDWLATDKGFNPARVGIFGESLGGATSLFAFAVEPRIAALFLESTYADLEQMIAEDLKNQGFPGFLASSAILMGRVLSGQNFLAHDPVAVIQQVGTRPIYVVHSQEDTRVPIDQARELVAAARAAGDNVTAWFTDHGEHVQTPAAYPAEFERRLVGFFHQSLGRP